MAGLKQIVLHGSAMIISGVVIAALYTVIVRPEPGSSVAPIVFIAFFVGFYGPGLIARLRGRDGRR